jgi:hypothetical protein
MGSGLKSGPGGGPHALDDESFLDFLSFPFAGALPESTPLFHRRPPSSSLPLSLSLSLSLSLRRSRLRFLSFFLPSFFSFWTF